MVTVLYLRRFFLIPWKASNKTGASSNNSASAVRDLYIFVRSGCQAHMIVAMIPRTLKYPHMLSIDYQWYRHNMPIILQCVLLKSPPWLVKSLLWLVKSLFWLVKSLFCLPICQLTSLAGSHNGRPGFFCGQEVLELEKFRSKAASEAPTGHKQIMKWWVFSIGNADFHWKYHEICGINVVYIYITIYGIYIYNYI